MKGFNTYLFPLFIITCLFFSCTSSENVVSNHFFAKRKYTKGWYVNTPVSEKKYSYRHTQREEEKTENNIIEDAQLSIEYAQVKEPIILTEKKLPNKTYALKTPTPTPQTDTIPAKKKPKKNFLNKTEKETTEGKKTNPYALASIIAFLWSIIIIPLLMADSLYLPGYFGVFLPFVTASVYLALLVWIFAAFTAFAKNRKTPDIYKNNGLAIPGVAVGVLTGLTALGIFLFFVIAGLDPVLLIVLGFLMLVPFSVIASLFYWAFIKRYHKENYHKAKKVYTKEDIEKKQSNLKKLGRWGIVMLASSFVVGLLMIIFAEPLLLLLPNNADLYFFVFVCTVFLTGLIFSAFSSHADSMIKKQNASQ